MKRAAPPAAPAPGPRRPTRRGDQRTRKASAARRRPIGRRRTKKRSAATCRSQRSGSRSTRKRTDLDTGLLDDDEDEDGSRRGSGREKRELGQGGSAESPQHSYLGRGHRCDCRRESTNPLRAQALSRTRRRTAALLAADAAEVVGGRRNLERPSGGGEFVSMLLHDRRARGTFFRLSSASGCRLINRSRRCAAARPTRCLAALMRPLLPESRHGSSSDISLAGLSGGGTEAKSTFFSGHKATRFGDRETAYNSVLNKGLTA